MDKPKTKKQTPTQLLKSQLQEMEKLRDEYLNGWQRAKADYENFKKGEAERTADSIKYFNKDWVLRILGLYDNLEMANKHLSDELKDDDWVKAVLAIQNQFIEGIEGLQEIIPEGEPFNPEEHEALEQVEVEGKEPDTVIEVLQKGYKLNDQVIRPAKVKVSK